MLYKSTYRGFLKYPQIIHLWRIFTINHPAIGVTSWRWFRLELRQQSRTEHLAVHFVVGDHEEIHPERWDLFSHLASLIAITLQEINIDPDRAWKFSYHLYKLKFLTFRVYVNLSEGKREQKQRNMIILVLIYIYIYISIFIIKNH